MDKFADRTEMKNVNKFNIYMNPYSIQNIGNQIASSWIKNAHGQNKYYAEEKGKEKYCTPNLWKYLPTKI